MPNVLNKTLKPHLPIRSEHIAIGPGIGAVLSYLIWHLCEVGDGVVITAVSGYQSFCSLIFLTPCSLLLIALVGLILLTSRFIVGFTSDLESLLYTLIHPLADYIRDIVYPAQAVPMIVPTPSELDSLSVEVVPLLRQYIQDQLAIIAKKQSHMKIRVLMLCNPHNPLARVYPKETIVEYARIAEEVRTYDCFFLLCMFIYSQFNLHLIVDEVFANEIFSSRYVPNPTIFTSILSFPPEFLPCNPSRIHVFWSPSKDLGASGVKIGVLISQSAANKPLIDTIRTSMIATPVSSASDAVFTAIMQDEAFFENFMSENRKNLGEAFELVGAWCESHGLG